MTGTSNEYAMYLRKSRVDLELEAMGEGETLARHRKMLFDLAAKHEILPDQVTIYHELVSGDSIAERPEMQRLLDDVCKRKYKAVLVVEIERLARGNTSDQGEVADAFQMSGTHIITPAKVYDPNNEFDQEYFEFGLFMSRREYKTIKRRLEAGKEESVKEGNFIPPVAPYGFETVRRSKKERTLKEKPEESRIVKMIFNWYTEDRKPTSWIANQLTLMGIPTPRNNPEWARATIKGILFNAHYIGMVSWGEQATVKEMDSATGKIVKRRRKDSANVKHYEGKHDGFISEEQFQKVKTIYGSNAPAKVNTELTNPLSGVLRCASCGRAMGFQNFNDQSRTPRIHHARTKQCTKKSLAFDVIMDSVVDALQAIIEDFEVKIKNDHSQVEQLRHQESINAMKSELAKQESRRRKLFDSWESEDGMYTKEEFIERKLMYSTVISQLKEQIKKAEAAAPSPVDFGERIATLRSLIACLTDPDINAREKNILLKQTIDHIDYDVIDHGRGKGGMPVLTVFLK